MLNTKMFRAAIFATALSLPMAATTSAQPPVVIGGGLVNVQIGTINVELNEVLSDITVTVPVNAAVQIVASVCNVGVGVAAQIVQAAGDCDAAAGDQDQIIRFADVLP